MKSYKILLAAVVAMTVAATPARADWSSSVATIMIDPGHGGTDPGAGRSGYRNEADLVLDCSLAIRDWLLSHGANSKNFQLTRSTNTDVSLAARRQMSINFDPWVFCSIHLNAFNGSAYGTETWYYWENRSHNLASIMQNELHNRLRRQNRGVKQNGWTVITGASYIPAILTESLFVDNVEENNMINSRNKAGFANWVNGHLAGFYKFMTSSAEMSSFGNQGLTDPNNSLWSNGGGTTPDPNPGSGSSNPAYDPEWESKPMVQKNVFAYNIRVDKSDVYKPRVWYQLNGNAAWVKVYAYINGEEVASADGTTYQLNEVTLDLGKVERHGDVTFAVKARTAEVASEPTLIKDDIPPSWTNNWHAKFFNATGVTVNNCTDSPTFGRIIVAESHKCDIDGYTIKGFVSSTDDSHGRGAMLYAFTPQMQPIPNPDLNGIWGFNGARNWDDKGYNSIGSWTKVRYSEDGRLFAASATSNTGYRGVYELTDNSLDGSSLNSPATRVLSTSYPVTGLDAIGKGNDLRLAVFGPGKMIYTPDDDGWFPLDYGVNDVPSLEIYWPNTNAKKTVSLSGIGMGHVDTQTLSVAFDPDGKGMTVGNARRSSYSNSNGIRYPMYMHVTENAARNVVLDSWRDVDGGAIAYSPDRQYMALSGAKGEIHVLKVTNTNGGIDRYQQVGKFNPTVGSSTRDIAFDYAGNIYITGDNCRETFAGLDDVNNDVYGGDAGMVSYQLPESWGGKVETTVPAPKSECIVGFQPSDYTDIADISADDNGVARVHPVPARTDLTVDSPEAINTIVVLSMSGAEVMHVEGNGEHSQTLNISHLPQGNYMLSVNGHAALRWIKL